MRVPRAVLSFSCVVFLATAVFLSPAVSQNNVITTIAGADWLFPGDGRRAIDAPIGGLFYMGVAVDTHGNFFIADAENDMVFKVDKDGILTVVAGNGIIGHTATAIPSPAPPWRSRKASL